MSKILDKIVDKIIDKIKGFGYSLVSMFQVEQSQEDESILDKDTAKGQEFAKVMKSALEENKKRAEERENEENQRMQALNSSGEEKIVGSKTRKLNELKGDGVRISSKSPKVKSAQAQDEILNQHSENEKDLDL